MGIKTFSLCQLLPKKLSPLPQSFADKVRAEWHCPLANKQSPAVFKRNYILLDPAEGMFQTPKVDGPVAGLQSSGLLTQDGEGTIRDPIDKKADVALRRAHEAMAMSIRVSTVASIVARANIVWARKMAQLLPPENRSLQEGASHWIRSVALIADATLDSITVSSRASAAAAARRLLWLRQWQADVHSKIVVASYPFQGYKLFGDPLE